MIAAASFEIEASARSQLPSKEKKCAPLLTLYVSILHVQGCTWASMATANYGTALRTSGFLLLRRPLAYVTSAPPAYRFAIYLVLDCVDSCTAEAYCAQSPLRLLAHSGTFEHKKHC